MTTRSASTSPSASGVALDYPGVARNAQRRREHWRFREKSAPYLFLSPYFLTAIVFFLYPLCYASILAFYQTDGTARKSYVGLSNFYYLFRDKDFLNSVWTTTLFTLSSICIQLPLSLGLALLLNSKNDRLKYFFRLLIFSPNLVGQVFVAIMFQMLFTPHYGLFNRMMQAVVGSGLDNGWLSEPSLILPAMVIASLWMWVGFNMIYFLAALQNVDQSLIEAAQIDGAGPVSVFFNVTLPAIMPVATFVVVTSTIGSFQLFELPYTLLQGNPPGGRGRTVVWYLYQQAFESGDLGAGAAVGWVLTFLILVVSLMQIRFMGAFRRDE